MMKRTKKIVFTTAMAFSLLVHPVLSMAAVDDSVQLTEDLGYLISSERMDNEDGTYEIEEIYIEQNIESHANNTTMSGKNRFTKVKEVYLNTGAHLLTYQLTASFKWNSGTGQVSVQNPKGKITYNQGGTITNKNITTSGNYTSKAKAKFTFTRTVNKSFSQNYKITIGCNYKGKCS